jgi:predicted lipoprotein with Yx(FWY)xxD motif
MSKPTIFIIIVIVIIVIIGAWWWVSNNQTPTTPTNTILTVNLGSSANLGNFLTDKNGATLYYFAKDTINTSNCTGGCPAIWPAFYESSISAPDQLNASDFGTITNGSGTKQTTYKGWPLYRYSGDSQAGDTKGDNFSNIWFVVKVPFYTVLVVDNSVKGIYLADSQGRTLYQYTKDLSSVSSAPTSTCTGQCLSAWPVFNSPQIIIPSSLDSGDFTSFVRPDRSKQTVYYGWPVYYFYGDSKPGDIKGDGVNNFKILKITPVPASSVSNPTPPKTPTPPSAPAPAPVADTAPSLLSNISPTNGHVFTYDTTQVEIRVDAYDATPPVSCKYNMNTDVAYNMMSGMMTKLNNITQSATLTGLSSGTTYTIYVRCIDSASIPNETIPGNKINFSLAPYPYSGGGGGGY